MIERLSLERRSLELSLCHVVIHWRRCVSAEWVELREHHHLVRNVLAAVLRTKGHCEVRVIRVVRIVRIVRIVRVESREWPGGSYVIELRLFRVS